MDFVDFTAGQDDDQRRLDRVIRVLKDDLTLGEIYKAIRKGLVKLNDKKTSADARVKKDDKISIAAFLINKKDDYDTQIPVKNKKNKATAQKNHVMLPEVLFKNEHIIIFNKPAGLLVQQNGTNEASLNQFVTQYYEENKTADSISFKTGPLHRLDKKTSGIICFSWSLEGARWFSKNLQDHKITKIYRGIVQGSLNHKETWKDNIQKDYDSSKKFQTVKIQDDEESNAWTEVTPLAKGTYNGKEITYVEFDIKTGKTHQIRSQSAHHGYPLLGDSAYKALKTDLSLEYFLHAWKIRFPENNLGLPSQIECPLPKDFSDFLLKTCDIKNCSL